MCLTLHNTGCVYVSEEEISNMRLELEKYGIQMPAFSKIGGILANELSVDEAACKEKWSFVLCDYSNRQIRFFEALVLMPPVVRQYGLLEVLKEGFLLALVQFFFFFLEHDDVSRISY